jgi:hypothetical protein
LKVIVEEPEEKTIDAINVSATRKLNCSNAEFNDNQLVSSRLRLTVSKH